MNALVKSNGDTGALTRFGGGRNPYEQVADEAGIQSGKFLKFDGNSGDFLAGKEKIELPHGTRLIANMETFSMGAICWVEGEVKDEHMVRILDARPTPIEDLPDYGPYKQYPDGTEDGWSEQISLVFKDYQGEEYTFKVTAASARRALLALSKDYGRGMRVHPDQFPVVELGSNTFIPKSNPRAGTKHAPTLKIVDWIPVKEFEALSSAGADDPSSYEGGAPAEEAPPQQAAPAPAPAPQGTVQPQGRRGRF